MKNKVLLPAAACAALPLLWASLPGGPKAPSGEGPVPAPLPAEPAPSDPAPLVQGGQPLASVEGPDADLSRAAIPALEPAGLALDTSPTKSVAAAPLPTEMEITEIGPDLAAKIGARFALFDEPTDGMYAAWYAGTSFEDLARLHFDGAMGVNVIATLDWTKSANASAAGFDQILKVRGSFTSEVDWLSAEVHRRTEHSLRPVTVALATHSDEQLLRAYPEPSDRYVLGLLLRRELNSLTREAAKDELAKLRALPAKERAKRAGPFLS